MAAPTVSVAESNGAAETVTASITNTNMGNVDAVNLVAATYPVTPGDDTYEKWQRLNVTNLGTASSVKNIKVWRTGALGGSAIHLCNCKLSSYGGAPVFAQPIKTDSSIAIETMPSAEPASANLGIGGSLTGELTGTGYSDYLVHQIQTDAADTAAATVTMNYQYDYVI